MKNINTVKKNKEKQVIQELIKFTELHKIELVEIYTESFKEASVRKKPADLMKLSKEIYKVNLNLLKLKLLEGKSR